jgi:hypothetical protein
MSKALACMGLLSISVGLLGPLLLDRLPISFASPSDGSHTYYRLVPTVEAPSLVPWVFIALGLLLCLAGIRRRPRK